MKSVMRIKFLQKFTNPLTGRKTEIGTEQNVPENLFWLKRIQAKDCEKVNLKKSVAPRIPKAKEPKKGSK